MQRLPMGKGHAVERDVQVGGAESGGGVGGRRLVLWCVKQKGAGGFEAEGCWRQGSAKRLHGQGAPGSLHACRPGHTRSQV